MAQSDVARFDVKSGTLVPPPSPEEPGEEPRAAYTRARRALEELWDAQSGGRPAESVRPPGREPLAAGPD